jgi:transposase
VIVHVRPKCACRACKKCIATPALLACVVSGKFLDRMPLYHLGSVLKRLPIDLSRATLAAWIVRSGELLSSVYGAMHRAYRP